MQNRVTQDALNGFVADLRATHRDNLQSVVMYGAAAVGDTELRADCHIVVALERITPEDLRLAQAPMREWQRLGFPAPVYFTSEELTEAADVFPIEFRRMETSRRVLFGRDPFETVEISDENLRHQTEYELRSKLLRLRRLYIQASLSGERIMELMTNSLASFAEFFAAVLMLKAMKPPTTKRAIITATINLLRLDSASFDEILRYSESRHEEINETEANEIFANYLIQIERVINAINGTDEVKLKLNVEPTILAAPSARGLKFQQG